MSKHVTFHYARPDKSYESWRLHRPDEDPLAATGVAELGAYWELDLPDDATELVYLLRSADGKLDPPSRRKDPHWQVAELTGDAELELLYPAGYADSGLARHLRLDDDDHEPWPGPDGLEPRVAELERRLGEQAEQLAEVRTAADDARQAAEQARNAADRAEEAAAGAEQRASQVAEIATQAGQAASAAQSTAGTVQNHLQRLSVRLGFVVQEPTTTPAPGLLAVVKAAADSTAALEPAVREAAAAFALRQRLDLGRLPSDAVPPPPDEQTVLRLLSVAEFIRQQRVAFERILADPTTAGGQTAEAFLVTANRVGEQARRQLDVLTGDAAALGLFVDTRLRLDLGAPDVQRPITELRFLVPPAPIPLPGPAPDPGQPPVGYQAVPDFAPTVARQP